MFQLSGLVTVDHTKQDAFLKNTRERYGIIAPNRLFEHADQSGAVSRCMASNGESNIVGHGKPGIICTGSGDFLSADPSKRIAVGNIGGWATSTMRKLTLLGCNTGEGYDGASLLFAIAQATGATVRAPTGYVYIGLGCEDYHLETGTGWQTATPAAKPAPIFDSQPSQFFPQHLKLMAGATFVQVENSSVTSFILRGPGPLDIDGPVIRRWDGEERFAPISRIEFDEPFRRGAPAAIETGKLEMILRAEGIEPKRLFRIYNDNRLQDMSYPEIFYRANITALRG